MPIKLTSDPPLVSIETYYVEEHKKQGHVIYHFIKSQEEMDNWKEKEYCVEDEKSDDTDPQKIIYKLITAWKRLKWSDQNSIFSSCFRFLGEGENRNMEIDPIRYRDLKLKSCLKRWNIVDEDDQPVPITPENIDKLSADVAQELLNGFEKVTEIGSDDSKK
ncbi:unnamed protein product [marine sediment metagenome]|uniref:Uncharacterized protein n=1 Tax=marine sediment metagenome TaxID=412755 RepID=X0TX47_9ZZZZ